MPTKRKLNTDGEIISALTDSQQKVLAWLQAHDGWFRPGQIQPKDYPGGASSIGRILGEMVKQQHVFVRSGDRGNGTVCKEYSAVVVRRSARVAFRGFAAGVLQFEELVDVDEKDIDTVIPALAEKHTTALVAYPHTIEIEFLDEPNPHERFFRFGTDPAGMVSAPRGLFV
jgi:hypothetical protein